MSYQHYEYLLIEYRCNVICEYHVNIRNCGLGESERTFDRTGSIPGSVTGIYHILQVHNRCAYDYPRSSGSLSTFVREKYYYVFERKLSDEDTSSSRSKCI